MQVHKPKVRSSQITPRANKKLRQFVPPSTDKPSRFARQVSPRSPGGQSQSTNEQHFGPTNIDTHNYVVVRLQNNLPQQKVIKKAAVSVQRAAAKDVKALKSVKKMIKEHTSVDKTRNHQTPNQVVSAAGAAQAPLNKDLAKDPTYIEPFILPKFEKQQQTTSKVQQGSGETFPMARSSQVSFTDIFSQIRSRANMSHMTQYQSKPLVECAKSKNELLRQQKKEMIKNELDEQKERKQLRKKLEQLKKLQNTSARENIKIIREEHESQDAYLQGLGSQKDALTDLNYVFDQKFHINLKQQGYLKQNLRSQFENDYEQYECFEKKFGTNQFRMNDNGQVICKKKRKNTGWQAYFEKLEKKREKMRHYNTSQKAQYLTHGLRMKKKEVAPSKAGLVTEMSVMTTREGQLPQIPRKSFQKFDTHFSTEEVEADQNNLHLSRLTHEQTKLAYKSRSNARCQKRTSSLCEVTNNGSHLSDEETDLRNSQTFDMNKKFPMQVINLAALKQQQMTPEHNENTIQETSIQHMNSGRTGRALDDHEPNLAMQSFVFGDQSQSIQTAYTPISGLRPGKGSTEVDLTRNVYNPQAKQQTSTMMQSDQSGNAFGTGGFQPTPSLSLTQRLSPTKSIESSQRRLQTKNNDRSPVIQMQNTNAIFTGGLSLEKSNPNTQRNFHKRFKEQMNEESQRQNLASKLAYVQNNRHKLSKSQIDKMPQIEEIELLRKTSKSNMELTNPVRQNFQKESYINQKLESFTDMVMNQQIRQTDLLNTLYKFKIASPRYAKGYWRDGVVGGSHSVMANRKNMKIKLVDQSGGDPEMLSQEDENEVLRRSFEKKYNVNQGKQHGRRQSGTSSILERVQISEERLQPNDSDGTGQSPKKDKVQQNMLGIARMKPIKELDRFCNYMQKEKIISEIRQRRESELDPKFLEDKFKIHRWKEFKERRLDAMKKFIHTKRKLRMTKLMVLQTRMSQIMFHLWRTVRRLKEERRVQYWKSFVGMQLINRFRKSWRLRYGHGGVMSITKNKMRHCFVLYHMLSFSLNPALIELHNLGRSSSMKQIIRYKQKTRLLKKKQAFRNVLIDKSNKPASVTAGKDTAGQETKRSFRLKKIFEREAEDEEEGSDSQKPHGMMDPYEVFFCFLEDRAVEWNNQNLINNVSRTFRSVLFMQRRFRSKLEIKQARIQVIMLMWDRMLVKIWNSISPRESSQAQRMTDVIGRIISVNPEVKKALVTAYIDRCTVNQNIAFAQWRQFFRENQCKHNLIQNNLSAEMECRDVFYEIQKSYHAKTLRRKMVDVLQKQPAVTQKTLWNDMLAEVVVKTQNKKKTVQIMEQEPFGILKTGPHHITKFSQLQWPEPTLKAEQDADRAYAREHTRFQRSLALRSQASSQSPATKRKGVPGRNDDLLTQLAYYDEGEKEDIYKLDEFNPRLFEIAHYLNEDELKTLVYPRYKYLPEQAPTLLYWPSQAVLFRLARAAFVGSLLIRRKFSKKNTKANFQKTQLDEILNISVAPRVKKKKGQLRMFYDDSFMEEALVFVRPDDHGKSEEEQAEDRKLKANIQNILDKKTEQEMKRKRIAEEEQAIANESINAESFFDIKSPDQFRDDDDDDIIGDKSNNNPFSLRSEAVRDIDENDEFGDLDENENENQTVALGLQDSLFEEPMTALPQYLGDPPDSSSSSDD